MENVYIEKEGNKEIESYSKEGWDFFLQNSEYKELAISTLSKILFIYQKVEFKYNNLYYEIFDSTNSGYVINVYSSNQTDEDGYYLEENIVDGGLCTGDTRDAVEFML